MLEDDDHDLLRLWPPVPAFGEIWRAYIATYEAIDADPFVGRRLVELLTLAGAAPTQTNMHFFGSCAGRSDFDDFVQNFIGLIEGAAKAIQRASSVSPERLSEAMDAIRGWAQRPDAAMWYVTCWAVGVRPEA